MYKTKKQKAQRRLKIASYIVLAAFFLVGARYCVPAAADVVLTRLEAQRDAEENYYCAYYGAAMNRYYGREVCEDEALHRSNLNPKTKEGI